MPRAIQFDPDATLETAMQQFWEAGFTRTSMHDLVRRTGLSRSSLYAAFHSKERLFELALAHYDRQMRRRELARLEQDYPPLSAIRELFRGWVRRATELGDTRGCLLVNTATELGTDCPGPGAMVARTQADTEAFFERALNAARERGELAESLDTQHAARSLLATLLGLLVLVRTRPDAALLESIMATALSNLSVPTAHGGGASRAPSSTLEGS